MKLSLKPVITPVIPLTVLLIAVSLLAWLLELLYFPFFDDAAFSISWDKNLLDTLEAMPFVSNVVSLLLTLFNAFLIAQLNNKYTIIRNRTFLPVFIFLLFISVWTETHVAVAAHFGLTMLILALYVFFDMYRDRKASEQAFLGSLLISIASLFIQPYLLLIPVCWMGFIRMYSFSLRTFLASVFGALVPWIFYFSIGYYLHPDMQWVSDLTQGFYWNLNILQRPVYEIIYMGVLFLIMMIGLVGLYANLHTDSVQTRAKLNFLMFLLLFSFIFANVFDGQYVLFLPFVAFTYTLLISHPFTLRLNNFHTIVFLVFIVVNFAYVITDFIYKNQ